MSGNFNENHKRHLLLTFEHVDSLLTKAVQELNAPEAISPFQRLLPDSLPVQRKVLGDYLSGLRKTMVRILEKESIAIPKPQISSLWSFQTTLSAAKISVEEIAPKYMRGYGSLSEEDAHELEIIRTRIMDRLDRMSGYLARGGGQELQARLKRMEKTTDEVESARLLERIITAHGLVELRPSLETVIERLESSDYEIGVFGRVSSGKSSLLNYILRIDALPVGVTPVTAIPTRVEFGARPLARIWFAEDRPISTDLKELPQYVTEQGNPDNSRHVTRILVELPSERLKAEGVTFVDTPGLGSLARYGEMESLAYLPSCDLGILLVDASSTLVQEDISIVNVIRQAGAEVMVLLTKADILKPEDRTTVVQYVRDQLSANLGFEVQVHPVSVKGPDAKLCDQWFETVMGPCLLDHRELAGMTLRRKVGLLKEATIASLRRRLDKKSTEDRNVVGRWEAVEPMLSEARLELEAAMRERLEWPGLTGNILNDAASDIVDRLRRDKAYRIDARSNLVSCGSRQLNHLADEVAGALGQLRESLIRSMRGAAASLGIHREDPAEIPVARGMPLLDLSASLPVFALRKPKVPILLKGLACHSFRSQLVRRFESVLTDQLDQYVKQLNQWRSQYLVLVRRAFTAEVDFYRAQCEKNHQTLDSTDIKNDLERLESFFDNRVSR